MKQAPKGYVLIKEEEYSLMKQVISLLQEQVKMLTQENQELKERVNQLESRINKNSTNSHKPPSTDGFRKPIQNSRVKTGKKPGAQDGHKGTTLKMIDNPDLVIEHPVQGLCSCGCNLAELPVSKIRRNQVIELVPRLIEIIEHRSEIKVCSCGRVHAGDGQIASAPVSYGGRLKALAVYFSQYEYIPFDRLQELFHDLFNLRISDGVLVDSNELCYENLEVTESEIKDRLLASVVSHFDETGIRCNKKLEWAHVCSTQNFTHLEMNPNRGRKAMDAIGILPNFKGVAIHDRYKSYDSYEMEHGFCNAHLLRDLKGISKPSRTWSKQMHSLLCTAKKFKEEGRMDPVMITKVEARYNLIVKAGFEKEPEPKPCKKGRLKKSEAWLLLEMFRDHQNEVLRFVTNPTVPFDNNQAERDFRMLKLRQKISGGFRTRLGGAIFCRIRSYISTLRKQGHPVLESIHQAMIGKPVSFAEVLPTG